MSTENHFHQRLTYFYCANVALLALGLFLHGFFPNNNIKGSFSSVTDLPLNLGNHWLNADEYCKRKVDKVVIMVIDAIRYDFIYEDGEINMPYTMSAIINDEACLFKLRANAPTVTMPRIKAITSGSVSNFFDILMNFGSSEMLDDNIIDQAKDNDFKIVFYGDDTWLRLFPWRFYRKEGTSSFYVSDYTEVDNNVTRNVDFELERNDWDIMILHYLGLDHIGHIDGPKSKLVKPKLNEMDGIIQKLHTYLLNEEQNGKKTLLLVLGDHGMADLGGHGGTSMPEIIIPLISFGLGCGGFYKSEIAQVDIASTLSILLGIPIPANNVGHVILPLLTSSPSLSTANTLYALYYNAYQVITQFLQNGGTILDEGYNKYWKAQLKHIDWLQRRAKNECDTLNIERLGQRRRKRMPEPLHKQIINEYKYALHLMSSHLLKSVGDFHLTEMIAGMFILLQLFLIALFGAPFKIPSFRKVRIVSAMVCCVTMLCWWMNLIDFGCCLSSLYSIAVTLIVIFIITLNFLLITNCKLSIIVTNVMQLKPDNLISFALLTGSILQTVSLSGTSLIENEEKVWYHLLVFVLMLTIAYSIYDNCQHTSSTSVPLTEFNNFVNLRYTILKSLLLLLVYRMLKNYQEFHYYSTIKWLPNKEYLACITIFGLFSVWWALRNIMSEYSEINKRYGTLFENLSIGICLLTAYYYRGVTGQLILPLVGNFQSRGVIEVKLFFLSLTGLIFVKMYKLRKYSEAFNDSKQISLFPQYLVTSMVEVVLICWILLCTLLARPHNIWLFWALFVTCKFFANRLNNIVYLTIVHYWIGIMFYFFQGNTNYISSIDITAGYVGQSDYNAVIAGLFIAINAFSFPVISYFLLLVTSFKRDWANVCVIYKVRSLMLIMHLFFYLLITTLHRYHLFIWSVFSPKLLYLSVNSVFIVVLYWFTEVILLVSY